MMLIPRRSDFDLLDDVFGEPFFKNHESNMMKTDIKEKEDKFLLDIDLPGYEKENIKMSIEDGYLTINASTSQEKDEKSERFILKERYSGSCSRSFYVGEDIKSEDIKAKFDNGILQIEIPKIERQKELPEKKYIDID